MRMDDYQKWLDDQFVDESTPQIAESAPTEVATAEVESIAPKPAFLNELAPSFPAPSAYSTPGWAEPSAPKPIHMEVHPLAPPPPTPTAASEEPAIPTLDDYIPSLRARSQPPAESVAPPIENRATPAPPPVNYQPEPAPEMIPVAVRSDTATITEEPIKRPIEVQPSPPRELDQKAESARPRYARATNAAEAAPPLDPDRLWNLAPKHLQVLLAMEPNEIAQHSYKRQFKESRVELISR